MAPLIDLYETLDVPRDADADTIKRAYRLAAQRGHPDKGGDAAAFQRLQRAYDVLSDPERRKRYDETGATDERDEEADVLQSLAEAMLRIIDQVDVATTDLVKKLRHGVEQVGAELQTQIAQREKRISRRRAALDRLKRRDGENLIAAMLEADAEKLERQNVAARAEIAKLDRVIAVIDGYEYRVDEVGYPGAIRQVDYQTLLMSVMGQSRHW